MKTNETYTAIDLHEMSWEQKDIRDRRAHIHMGRSSLNWGGGDFYLRQILGPGDFISWMMFLYSFVRRKVKDLVIKDF